MSRVASAVLCAVAIAATLSACSDGRSDISGSPEPASVAAALIAAQANDDVDPAQVDVLEVALAAERYPSDSEYRTAYEAAVQCMRDLGVASVNVDEYWNAGLLSLSVGYSSTLEQEEAAVATVIECERIHVAYIARSRASEDVIRGAQAAIQAEFLPALKACLAERGYPVPDDADAEETTRADGFANEAEGTQTGCMESTGYLEAMTGPPAN